MGSNACARQALPTEYTLAPVHLSPNQRCSFRVYIPKVVQAFLNLPSCKQVRVSIIRMLTVIEAESYRVHSIHASITSTSTVEIEPTIPSTLEQSSLVKVMTCVGGGAKGDQEVIPPDADVLAIAAMSNLLHML